MGEDVRLGVTFAAGADATPAELDELTAALRRELLGLDVTSVDRVSAGPAPGDSRGVDLAALGTLVVTLTKATPVLGQVVEVLRAWSARNPNRTAKLTLDGDSLEVGGLSEAEQGRVIADWMARHAAPPAPSAATASPPASEAKPAT